MKNKKWSPKEISRFLELNLLKVQKPGRYIGGELNQVTKKWADIATKVVLAFPDTYDLGLPNLGLMILYDILNKLDTVLAERVYAPWTDMEKIMRQENVPLYALESKTPLSNFDIVISQCDVSNKYLVPHKCVLLTVIFEFLANSMSFLFIVVSRIIVIFLSFLEVRIKMDFEIEEGGITKYFYLTRKSDGREFVLMRFYDPNLECFDEGVEGGDGKAITKEDEEAVKKAVREFLGEEE